MKKSIALFALLLIGCGHGTAQYRPEYVARGEILLHYDDGIEMWSGGRKIAESYDYKGLPEFVDCVPTARDQALAARSSGSNSTVFAGLGVGFGTASLAGLSGFAFQDKPAVMGALFAAGISSAIAGIVFGALSRSSKTDADGHAVDAMNYYNDEVGSKGQSCH